MVESENNLKAADSNKNTKVFCKLQLVNVVYYEGNELLAFEWRKNIMPLK